MEDIALLKAIDILKEKARNPELSPMWLRRVLQHAIMHLEGNLPFGRVLFCEDWFEGPYEWTPPPPVPQPSEGMAFCPTGKHEYPEGEDSTDHCDCREANCGCAIDMRYTSICELCSFCEPCCQNNGDCFYCDGCSETKSTVNQCKHCGNQCFDCCDSCFTCNGCGRRRDNDEACSRCEMCTAGCCECRYCDHCCETVSGGNYCDDCDRCTDCCMDNDDCDGGGGKWIKFRKSKLRFHESDRKQFKVNPLHRMLSCEIEVDRVESSDEPDTLSNVVDKWSDAVCEDGSLSGRYAHEINTMPTNGDRFVEHITEITKAYKEVGASCSPACGLHVHVDARDLTLYDIRRVIILYNRVERAMFELVSPARLNAHYSAVCGHQYLNGSRDPYKFKRQMLGALYNGGKALSKFKDRDAACEQGSKIRGAKRDKYQQVRYRALNLHSFFHRSTVEFRHHEGSVKASEIISWALICGNVIEYAYRHTEAHLEALPTDTYQALLAVIPTNLRRFCKKKWAEWQTVQVDYDNSGDEYVSRQEAEGYWQRLAKMDAGLPEIVEPVKLDALHRERELSAAQFAIVRDLDMANDIDMANDYSVSIDEP